MSGSNNTFVWAAVFWLMGALPALAHAAEQGFVLLLPTQGYIIAGTLSVVASILLLAILPAPWTKRIFAARNIGKGVNLGGLKAGVSLLAAALFGALIYVGFNGPSDPQANLLPLTIWTVWWIALFLVQGLIFDVWGWVNPWAGLARLMTGAPLAKLPERLASWPAVAIFVLFQCFILTDIAPNDPRRLAGFAFGYWLFTLMGMLVFGARPWLRQVECFSVMFRLIGHLRPLRQSGGSKIGLTGWGAVDVAPLTMSDAVFCIVILASGTFDGLHETFWWLAQIGVNPLEFPGRSAVFWPTLIGLLGANLVLLIAFYGVLWLGVLMVPGLTVSLAFRWFAVALLPIGLGYHFGHYFVTFLLQIQYVIVTLADPLAKGWNLFGLGSSTIKTGFLATPSTVKIIWLTQAGVVVASHILSVLMSHRLALGLCSDGRGVVRLQLGLSVLMVGYTVFGLWLLASPRGV